MFLHQITHYKREKVLYPMLWFVLYTMLLAVFHPDDTQKGYSTRVVKDVFTLSSG